jgi:hypothetical protein
LFLNWLADSKRFIGVINGAGPGCCISISLLGLEIDQSGQTTIAISALHKCDGFATSTVLAVPWVASIAIPASRTAIRPKVSAAPDTPMAAPRGITVKNASLPLYPSKLGGFKPFERGESGHRALPNAPTADRTEPATILIRSTLAAAVRSAPRDRSGQRASGSRGGQKMVHAADKNK